jgi:uncharacterized membrane protein
MAQPSNEVAGKSADERVDVLLGNLLRAGVLAAAVVVFIGGVIFLVRHGHDDVDPRRFNVPSELRRPSGIVTAVLDGRGRAIIQLGVLLLVATPVARVIFSVFAFGLQRDWTYVIISLIVLAVLVYSLFSGQVE